MHGHFPPLNGGLKYNYSISQLLFFGLTGGSTVINWLHFLLPHLFLEVASSPVFQQKPRNVTEKLYETVYFPCQAIGFPTPTIKWVKYSSGNQETAIETSGRFVINQDGYLYILGVEWSDSGRYACIAENTHGRIIAYAHLNVVTGKI